MSIIAKKINLFNRDQEDISKSDVCLTYIFILFIISTLSLYVYLEHIKYQDYQKQCIKDNSNYHCIKLEAYSIFIDIFVHKIGSLVGFFLGVKWVFGIVSDYINILCCFIFCCSKKNPNSIELTLNKLDNKVVNI